MRETVIIGVDPGLTGGIAFLRESGELIHVMPMPLIPGTRTVNGYALAVELGKTLQADHPAVAYIEWVTGRPRQAGVFQFGFNAGVVHGVLNGHGMPVQSVTPPTWKAHFGIRRETDQTKAEKKTEARELASRIYPAFADRFKRVKDDGLAEAVLIARYGWHRETTTIFT